MSSTVKGHGVDRKPMSGFLSYLNRVQHHIAMFEIFNLGAMPENLFHFRFGRHKYFGFPPKTLGNNVSWDCSTLFASMVKIGGNVRLIERSTALCDRLDHSQKLILS